MWWWKCSWKCLHKPFVQFRSCLSVIHLAIPVVLLDLQFHSQQCYSCNTDLCWELWHLFLCRLWARCSNLLQKQFIQQSNWILILKRNLLFLIPLRILEFLVPTNPVSNLYYVEEPTNKGKPKSTLRFLFLAKWRISHAKHYVTCWNVNDHSTLAESLTGLFIQPVTPPGGYPRVQRIRFTRQCALGTPVVITESRIDHVIREHFL